MEYDAQWVTEVGVSQLALGLRRLCSNLYVASGDIVPNTSRDDSFKECTCPRIHYYISIT